ncbi:DUF1848 family protein [Desulfosporosinus sp. SB140]|uniref:DUF1848 family protein n=1 Tax=Desulfosporosinus paludis TaxID=3115649 RepID=UPI003890E5B8
MTITTMQDISVSIEDNDPLQANVYAIENPRPLMNHLSELDERGFQCFFHHTLSGYPSQLEPYVPQLDASIDVESPSLVGWYGV